MVLMVYQVYWCCGSNSNVNGIIHRSSLTLIESLSSQPHGPRLWWLTWYNRKLSLYFTIINFSSYESFKSEGEFKSFFWKEIITAPIRPIYGYIGLYTAIYGYYPPITAPYLFYDKSFHPKFTDTFMCRYTHSAAMLISGANVKRYKIT